MLRHVAFAVMLLGSASAATLPLGSAVVPSLGELQTSRRDTQGRYVWQVRRVAENDAVGNFSIYAVPVPGKKYVRDTGVVWSTRTSTVESIAAFSSVALDLARYCVNVRYNRYTEVRDWLETKLSTSGSLGSGVYERRFGPVRALLSIQYTNDDNVSVTARFIRTDSPGTAIWPDYCTLP